MIFDQLNKACRTLTFPFEVMSVGANVNNGDTYVLGRKEGEYVVYLMAHGGFMHGKYMPDTDNPTLDKNTAHDLFSQQLVK